MSNQLIADLTQFLTDSGEGFTYAEILKTFRVHYTEYDIKHVLNRIAYKEDRKWKLRELTLPVDKPIQKTTEKVKEQIMNVFTCEQLLDFLNQHPEGITYYQAAKQLRMSTTVFNDCFNQLKQAGKACKVIHQVTDNKGVVKKYSRYVSTKHKGYVNIHLRLKMLKTQAAEEGYRTNMSLKDFPETTF